MTAPIPDDPFEGLPAKQGRVGRELVGLLLLIVGVVVLLYVLATVDTRLVVAAGGVSLVATGVWLGRGRDGEA